MKFNGDDVVTESIAFEGEGYPLYLDRFTGDILPFGAFTLLNGYIRVNITLATSVVAAI